MNKETSVASEITRLSVEDALARLSVVEDYDPGNGPGRCVHTMRGAAFGFLGAHWYLDDARAAFEKHGAEEAGPLAQAVGHGVVITDETGPVFFETKGDPA